MFRIKVLNGPELNYNEAVPGSKIASDLGDPWSASAVGIRIGNKLCDLSTLIDWDCVVKMVTNQVIDGRMEADAFYLAQHSGAHVAAEAICTVFPDAQLVYGPPTDDGFYYDIEFAVRPPSADDFSKVEAEIDRIIREDRPFTRYEMSAIDGMNKLQTEGSKYKIDNAERALAVDPEACISFYATGKPGQNFEDLCRGPHLPSTGWLGTIKILSIASSYWKGDAKLGRLTRIYGRAAYSQEEMNLYLRQREETKERDHRVIGKNLGLYATNDDVGQGLILWPPAGAIVRRELETFISDELLRRGYSQVYTPHIGRLALYRTSGHYPYYSDSQFPPILMKDSVAQLGQESATCAELVNRLQSGDELLDGYLLKPMNCPHHIKIFDSQPRSYRELPVRLAEFGTVYRWEQSGEIGGMTRVRGFTQDDAHLFCAEDQVPGEISGCLDLVKLVLGTLGINDYRVRIGLRDDESDKYTGESAAWDKAEDACRQAARGLGVEFTEEVGEAAFYGPKIDFVVRDVIGRDWQLGTVQCDYNLPERFDLNYVGQDNRKHRPVMIHRAPFGSLERFVGLLIEHFNGAFPVWLAPEQVRILTINESSIDYGQQIQRRLSDERLRVTIDDSGDRIQGKVRRAMERKIPYLLVVGPRNELAGTANVRVRDLNKDIGELSIDEFTSRVTAEFRSRKPTSFACE